jgi:hypothetical protein
MHPGSDHHVVSLIQEDRRVVGVDPVQREGEDARSVARVGRPEESKAGLARERPSHEGVQLPLPGLDRVEPDATEVVDRRVGSDHSGVVLEPRLEPVRRRPEGVVGEGAPLDRLAAEEEGAKRGDRARRGREHANPCRPEHLVGRDRVKIDPERVQVDPLMRCGLAAIEQYQRTPVVRSLGDLADR